MKSRFAASLAISALVLVGATGCTFITPQASTIPYSASSGVNVPDSSGPLQVRNAIIIASEDGSVGHFVAAIINPTDKAASLKIQISGVDAQNVRVPAGETISLGATEEPLVIEGLDSKPGTSIEVHFQSGDANGEKVQVPVLDGTLPEYADLAP